MRGRSRLLIVGLGVAWMLLVVGGFAVLWRYKSTPGPTGAIPATWPTASRLPRDTSQPTLLLFAHPRCVCTRATLTELRGLLPRLEHKPRTEIVLFAPEEEADWQGSELWQLATTIPDTRVIADRGGAEARLFGAETSGTALLYDSSGRLLFSGGLTAARGHEGDSFGQHRLQALLAGQAPDRDTSPIFGCSLHDPMTANALAEGGVKDHQGAAP